LQQWIEDEMMAYRTKGMTMSPTTEQKAISRVRLKGMPEELVLDEARMVLVAMIGGHDEFYRGHSRHEVAMW
jgi:hypothetical protein